MIYTVSYLIAQLSLLSSDALIVSTAGHINGAFHIQNINAVKLSIDCPTFHNSLFSGNHRILDDYELDEYIEDHPTAIIVTAYEII